MSENTNTSNPTATPEPSKEEVARLWHELRESQAREEVLANAGRDLVNAITSDFGGGLPDRTARARDRMLAVLPADQLSQLTKASVIDDDDEGSRLDTTTKVVLFVLTPVLVGLVAWAYAVTLG